MSCRGHPRCIMRPQGYLLALQSRPCGENSRAVIRCRLDGLPFRHEVGADERNVMSSAWPRDTTPRFC